MLGSVEAEEGITTSIDRGSEVTILMAPEIGADGGSEEHNNMKPSPPRVLVFLGVLDFVPLFSPMKNTKEPKVWVLFLFSLMKNSESTHRAIVNSPA